jgi:hypothetical protein
MRPDIRQLEFGGNPVKIMHAVFEDSLESVG